MERGLTPELHGRPVAVVQYNPFDVKALQASDDRRVDSGSLIAVSYEARAKGVKRIMSGQAARDVCPELILIQVPVVHTFIFDHTDSLHRTFSSC